MVATRYLRFNVGAEPRERAASLERLLVTAEPALPLEDWRAQAFEQLAPQSAMPAAAPLAALAATDLHAAQSVCIASAVSYMAEPSNVRMAGNGVLPLEPPEPHALIQDFNRIWADAGVVLAQADDVMLAFFNHRLEVATVDPTRAAGKHLAEFLPGGRDGPQLRRLMSEMEMWLFDHPVNRARLARRAPPISGLWLWGAGAPLDCLPDAPIAAHGSDVVFRAYNVDAALPANLRIAEAVPGTAAWTALESEWLLPTLAGLRRGEFERLTLSAGERSVQINKPRIRPFWRRTQPWWHYFE